MFRFKSFKLTDKKKDVLMSASFILAWSTFVYYYPFKKYDCVKDRK